MFADGDVVEQALTEGVSSRYFAHQFDQRELREAVLLLHLSQDDVIGAEVAEGDTENDIRLWD